MDKEIIDSPKSKHKPVKEIKIKILEDGGIEFYNDGDGIHIEYLHIHLLHVYEMKMQTKK